YTIYYTMIHQIIVGVCVTNCYLFCPNDQECIIIDPGGDEVEIISKIKTLGVTPLGIVLTHGHFDHVAALSKVKEYFLKKGQDLSIAIHEEDNIYLGESGESVNKQFLNFFGFNRNKRYIDYISSIPQADIFLKENDKLFNTNITVIETPGHTKGSICLYSAEDNILFSGDTLFYRGIGRTDFPDGNQESIIRSIKTKLFTLPDDTIIYPGHGPTSMIGGEKEEFYY
ncbi:MAG: MBL fold metallo-hydrolase, partial [Spirochaetales bacterium]|nr:MBL fold metallo-hydrolase [Spirochaetales bacterium]